MPCTYQEHNQLNFMFKLWIINFFTNIYRLLLLSLGNALFCFIVGHFTYMHTGVRQGNLISVS